MMRAAGVVCEYNPFHNGHAYHLAQTRLRGYTHIAAVMSGDLVQRGGLAMLDKECRARAALCCGADLVLELPAAWAGASAERFAWGAVYLLHSLGCLSALSFGSETGDAGGLRRLGKRMASPSFHEQVRVQLREGSSYPAARQQVLDRLSVPALPPNDLLGAEYAKAVEILGSPLELEAVLRKGAGHDQEPGEQRETASASALRRLVEDRGWEAAAPFLPPQALELFSQAPVSRPALLDRAFLMKLRQMEPERFAALPDCTEGLDRRFYRYSREAENLDQLLELVKTKRYPLSRLRRILTAAAVGITREDQMSPPPYLRVLGANARGLELLAAAKAAGCPLPVGFSLAKLRSQGPKAERAARLEAAATDLFFLSTEKIYPCGLDYTRKAVIMKETAL